MLARVFSFVGKPETLLILGVLFAMSAGANRLLGGSDVVVGAFGLAAAGSFAAAIAFAAMQHERDRVR